MGHSLPDGKVLRTGSVKDVLTHRSPDIKRYTVSSNGRLGRMLLDAELCPDSTSKADKDQARTFSNNTQSRLSP